MDLLTLDLLLYPCVLLLATLLLRDNVALERPLLLLYLVFSVLLLEDNVVPGILEV